MGEKPFSLNFKLGTFSLTLLSAFILVSCKKQDLELSRISSEPAMALRMTPKNAALVQEAKKWFEVDALKDSLRSATIYIGNPDWNSATIIKVAADLPEALEMPLRDYNVNYSYTSKMSPRGFRYLLVRKDADTKKFLGDVIELHPDTAYRNRRMALHRKTSNLTDIVNNQDYTGYFLVYTLKNHLRYGEKRENGRAIATLSR